MFKESNIEIKSPAKHDVHLNQIAFRRKNKKESFKGTEMIILNTLPMIITCRWLYVLRNKPIFSQSD